ncbi:hypothetical protein [Streptomyces sp. NPDC058086]|uniref:hypothetical protein n=1 Tax=Streptomyces sp. NPDC058086 TaxID=3346334 RepID=UPI0036F15D91
MAELCPGAVFNLSKTIYFTAAQQRIETQGLPTDGTRAILRVTSPTLAMAVFGHDQSGAVLQNVEVDGSRPQYGRIPNSDALIEMGGNSTGQAVRNVYAHHTRGWSDLHLFGGDSTGGVPGCQQATLSGNLLYRGRHGYAGHMGRRHLPELPLRTKNFRALRPDPVQRIGKTTSPTMIKGPHPAAEPEPCR